MAAAFRESQRTEKAVQPTAAAADGGAPWAGIVGAQTARTATAISVKPVGFIRISRGAPCDHSTSPFQASRARSAKSIRRANLLRRQAGRAFGLTLSLPDQFHDPA